MRHNLETLVERIPASQSTHGFPLYRHREFRSLTVFGTIGDQRITSPSGFIPIGFRLGPSPGYGCCAGGNRHDRSSISGVLMSVYRFTVPGHATRREFAVYVVVAHRPDAPYCFVYVGKTGDNRDGCNPVISRAGNHFSYNKIHSQVRNKLLAREGGEPHLYDYEYFYVTFDPYNCTDETRRESIDLINEMERAANVELTRRLETMATISHLNEYKGNGYVHSVERDARRKLRTPERMRSIASLVDAVMEYIETLPNSPTIRHGGHQHPGTQ